MIRPAHPTDAPRIREIAYQAYLGYVSRIGRRPAPMIADFKKQIADKCVWVQAERGINGYVVMYPLKDALHVENLAVDPLLHMKGYGKELIEYAESYARSLGLAQIELYTNVEMTENLSFYPAHGFHETSRAVDDSFSRVYFTKFLDLATEPAQAVVEH